MKHVGYQVPDSDMHQKKLLSNMTQVTIPIGSIKSADNTKESLPKAVGSLVFHGSCKASNGEIRAMVSVLAKGANRHELFPEQNEPHAITESVATRWIYNKQKNQKNL